MKKQFILILIIVSISLLLGACTPNKSESVDQAGEKLEQDVEELNSKLEEMSEALVEESKKLQEEKENLETEESTEEQTTAESETETAEIVEETTETISAETTTDDSTFELGADAISLDEKSGGYKLKIEGHGVPNNSDFTINIQNTGKNAMESSPADLTTGHDNRGHNPLYYLVKDDDILIIKAQGLEGNQYTINIDLPIKELDVEGRALVNLNANDMPLDKVEIEGAAEVILENVNLEHLEVELEGAAEISAKGKLEDLDLEVEGACVVDFSKMPATKAELEIEGSANVIVSVRDKLKISAEGSNKIGYYGSPTTEIETEGNSEIEQLEATISE